MKRLVHPELPPPEEWVAWLQESYDQNHFSNFGPVVRRLETALTDFAGVNRALVGVANATGGLTAALIALGVRGKVLVPSFTFPATVSAIAQAGCEPVYADVCPTTWEMTEREVRTALARDPVAAILHVRAFGFGRDLGGIEAIARDAGVPLIIDSAAAFGGTDVAGCRVGGAGDVEIFSFHATKPFGIGEGGAISAPEALAAEIRTVINFSLARDGPARRWGVNGKMSEFHAAIGMAVLTTFESRLATRRAQAAGWRALLDHPALALPVLEGAPPWQIFPLRLAGIDVGEVKAQLARAGYETRSYYAPALCPDPGAAPVSALLAQEMLSLPVGPHITPDDQQRVAEVILTQVNG